MSDDIFIKHGLGAFQQPYIGRASVNAQEPIISQRDARTPGNARQPGTYQHRTPGTYQLPASAQTPFIRNRQTPNIRAQQEPNIRNAQEPNIRSQQEPNIRDNQTVITYQHRTPSIYQNSYQHRQPSTYQHQSPSISRSPRNYQVPSTYQHRSPDTYPVIARRPVTYDHRSPAIKTYQHPTTATVQSTYQVTSQKQNPFIRNKQSPYIFSFRSPFIQGYQTPYNHQQPATGFLTVGQTEFVARASELITGFGTGSGIPNDQNSVAFRQQGASSVLGTDIDYDESTSGNAVSAVAGVGFHFVVQYTNTNDVQILVKEASSVNGLSGHLPQNSRVGNMSSSSSSSFSYTSSNLGTSSFFELFKLTNIGANRAQVKVNFPNPTASPYSLNTSQWDSAFRHYTPNGSELNDASATSGSDLCTPITWPRTTNGTTTNVSGDPSEEHTAAKFSLGTPTGTTGITTSYANLATHGLSIGYRAEADTASEGNAELGGVSTIIEFIVKDLDSNVEHKCDLLVVFSAVAEAESNQNDEEGGE